jgi:hypothetical protein
MSALLKQGQSRLVDIDNFTATKTIAAFGLNTSQSEGLWVLVLVADQKCRSRHVPGWSNSSRVLFGLFCQVGPDSRIDLLHIGWAAHQEVGG